MTYLAKPKLHHPELPKNKLGFTRRDYEGAVSTLCAGCGHDSISAAIIQACFELDVPPHRVAKLSGIGCSSKTPTYFLGNSHGFNSVHGRMPSVLTGANLANRELIYLGVSGDGDSASIGLGQFAHAMRRGVNMVYIVENNGVYGLTKGQFSATADKGSKSKRGAVNNDEPIDLVMLALQLGATFVARSFSGDKEQLVPLIKAAIRTRARPSSTSSAPASRSTTTPARPRATTTCASTTKRSTGSTSCRSAGDHRRLRAGNAAGGRAARRLGAAPAQAARGLRPGDRIGAMNYLQQRKAPGEIVTGLLYVEPDADDLHAHLNTVDMPLNRLGEKELVPGRRRSRSSTPRCGNGPCTCIYRLDAPCLPTHPSPAARHSLTHCFLRSPALARERSTASTPTSPPTKCSRALAATESECACRSPLRRNCSFRGTTSFRFSPAV